MNHQSDKSISEEHAQGESTHRVTRNRSLPPQPRYLLVAWILLLLLGAFSSSGRSPTCWQTCGLAFRLTTWMHFVRYRA
jgi:hypothetical protein